MSRSTRIYVCSTLMVFGYFLVLFPQFPTTSIEQILKEKGLEYLGYAFLVAGFSWFSLELTPFLRKKGEESFSNVDARRREREQTNETKRILDEIKELKEGQQTVDYGKFERLIKESTISKKRDREKQFESFENYFESLSSLLEEQAQTADEKASILLDKGTMYSRNGILFFFFTIVAWQITASIYGFKTQHIYGIASCSLLFIFIEFLSAWFLKQYRHYVETSTYLLKIKSIFDRYMLSYLAISKNESGHSDKFSNLTSLLSDDIRWPESYSMKNPDISFAKEALETMSHFAKTMKSEAKNTNKSKTES